jgi:DNA polymerase-3 subunit alpha (Gram-positive type)
LYESDATKFHMDEDQKALIPPFAAIAGVGEAAARNLTDARASGPFLSIEDLQDRSRISKSVVEVLLGLGCLDGLPESNQLTLFRL